MSGSYGKTPKYVSPFVADALYRAKLRANNAPKAKQSRRAAPQQPVDTGGGWDSSVSRNVLFDPTLHKQDIFKLAPKRHSSRRDHAGRASEHDDVEPVREPVSRMTRRRPEDSPPRRPRALRHTTHEGSDPVRIEAVAQSWDQSVELNARDGSVVNMDLSKPYAKVCDACHSGSPHGHSHGHHHTHKPTPRHRSPPQSRGSSAVTHKPPLPHVHERGSHSPHQQSEHRPFAHRGSRDSLVSRARYDTDSDEDDVIRVVTRATSPIDEETLYYLNEGKDPSWVALSGLEHREPMQLADPDYPSRPDAAHIADRGHPPIHPTPQHSSFKQYPSHAPHSALSLRHDGGSTPHPPGSSFAPRSARSNADFHHSNMGTPAHDLNIPRFQSSLDHSVFEESVVPRGDIHDIFKVQVQAQTQVIESIAKMMESIAGLSKKDRKHRRRRIRTNQPITVQIGSNPAIPFSQQEVKIQGSQSVESSSGNAQRVNAESAPVSKAAIMDLILSKLQNLDKFEKEIMSELQAGERHVQEGTSYYPPTTEAPATAATAVSASGPEKAESRDPVLDIMAMLPPSRRTQESSPVKSNSAQVGINENVPNCALDSDKQTKGETGELPANISIVDPNPKPPVQKKTEVDPRLEIVKYGKEEKHEFRKYIKELENSRAKREVPFKAKGITMVEAVETLSESLFEEYLGSVSKEVEKTLDNYAEELFNTI